MKTKITLVLIFFISYLTGYSQTPPFIHYATASNIFGSTTEIDHPGLNGWGAGHLVVQKVRVDDVGTLVNNPHYIGAKYNPLNERWYIYNEDPGNAMIENSCYLVTYTQGSGMNVFGVKSTATPLFPNRAIINNPVINDDSLARCMASRSRDADDVQINFPIELFFDYLSPGNWNLSVPAGQNMPVGAYFNLHCNPLGFIIAEHESFFENIGSDVVSINDYAYWTVIDHPLLNNNPGAFFSVRHRREPATDFIYRSTSIQYDTAAGRWRIHIELESYISGFSFPIGRLFNLFIWDATLGVNQFDRAKAIKFYPNPANSIVTFEAKQNISNISIFNALGQKLNDISSEAKNKLQIDMIDYETGYYFAKIQFGDNFEVVKLIKN